MKRIFRDLLEDQGGQAVTEFALVVPLLLVLLFAIFDFGRAVFYWNDENHVANLGARYAAVSNVPATGTWPSCGTPAPPDTLAGYVWCEANADTTSPTNGSPGLTATNGATNQSQANNGVASGVCVTVSAPGGATAPTAGTPLTVTVAGQYNYLPFSFAGGSLFQGTIKGTATMRLEQSLPAGNSVISTYNPGGATC